MVLLSKTPLQLSQVLLTDSFYAQMPLATAAHCAAGPVRPEPSAFSCWQWRRYASHTLPALGAASRVGLARAAPAFTFHDFIVLCLFSSSMYFYYGFNSSIFFAFLMLLWLCNSLFPRAHVCLSCSFPHFGVMLGVKRVFSADLVNSQPLSRL